MNNGLSIFEYSQLFQMPIENIEIIHTYSTMNGQIWALFINKKVHFYYETENKLTKVQEILDTPLSNITVTKLRNYLQLSYPRLAQLNDGTYKLYLSGRLLGGGKISNELQTAMFSRAIWNWDGNDDIIQDILHRRIHWNLFHEHWKENDPSWPFRLTFERTSHSFMGILQDARKITFIVGQNHKKFHNLFISPLTKFFMSFGAFDSGNTNASIDAIFGSEKEEDIYSLRLAYYLNKTLIVYISKDLQYMDVDSS